LQDFAIDQPFTFWGVNALKLINRDARTAHKTFERLGWPALSIKCRDCRRPAFFFGTVGLLCVDVIQHNRQTTWRSIGQHLLSMQANRGKPRADFLL